MPSASVFSVRAAARERPDAPALVTADATLSFADVAAQAAPIAASLAREPTAIVAQLRLPVLLAIYALLERRAPIVPLHPRLTPAERTQLVELASARAVLDESWTPPTTGAWPDAPAAHDDAGDEQPMGVMFTSGSTGLPKGVEISRRAFAAAVAASAARLGWRDDDRWLLCMPIAHVGGLSVVLRCLAARVPVVLSPWTGALEPMLDAVATKRVTILSLVPTMLARIFEELPAYRFPSHVRAVFLGGDATSPSLLARAKERGVPVITTYGMTEACSQIATLAPGEPADAASGVGRPLDGTEVRVVDGVIQVRGPTLFTRYVPADRWPAPFLEGGWFSTGDVGHLDEAGRLHVTGRASDLVITGGENVDPREVEEALVGCPGVRSACVFGVPDERWGQLVAAAVVLEPRRAGDDAPPPSLEAIVAHARGRLARHKWPRRAAVCDALVLNASGKLDRRRTAAAVTPSLVTLR